MRAKETFNILRDGRKFNPAPQSFQLAALKKVFSAGETLERIRLGEAVGYWGHRIRQLTGKIDPTEFEVIQVDGKAVVVNVEPIIRTLSVEVADNGDVTQEQEFADTELGRKAYDLYKQGFGGFSWAMSGRDGTERGEASLATSFKGFDFVRQPNFIPIHRQNMLLSSVSEQQDQLLSSLKSEFGEEDAGKMLNRFTAQPESDAAALTDLIVSSLLEQEESRKSRLSAALDKLPFMLTDDQKAAFVRQGPEDIGDIVQLLSSIQKTDLSQFPHEAVKVSVQQRSSNSQIDDLVQMTTGLTWK
jgi:hypothetical protein